MLIGLLLLACVEPDHVAGASPFVPDDVRHELIEPCGPQDAVTFTFTGVPYDYAIDIRHGGGPWLESTNYTIDEIRGLGILVVPCVEDDRVRVSWL